ncbi:M23 family metallopeptidase [Rhodobacter maris]|uniref:Murein DD-endopeptidase MepM/ murein hydrolase activator NlpD n=1 Tax=Rhodobacter maris TaxID=446682 RepID=A0A285TCC8_9RHOB|nr:M23 family metallopeptidase [Rhodobacter maris]SOC19688.1 murein DD-endopeptidase MepM/ murein hydrolase activator NlpD [Rhodobacter maris]
MADPRRNLTRLALTGVAALALSGCMDADLRGFGNLGFDTTDAARQATANRPAPDARGVISYPNYQVAVARQGDTVAAVATRLGVDPDALARYNALKPTTSLNRGEVLSLPNRVAEPAAAPGAAGSERIDITSLASGAIDRAAAGQSSSPAAPPAAAPRAAPAATATAPVARPAAPASGTQPATAEPVRHRVARGETAYSIARYYNVSAKALAEWNGLPADLSVREGQYLLIPVASGKPPAPATAAVTQPGEGSPTPEPPSAAAPLPADNTPRASAPVDKSAAPDLGASRSAASSGGKLAMPVSGSILRPYVKGKNDGVDISAAPGTAVKAAEAGVVAAITKDTEQVPILVLRHDDGLLTVYANLEGIAVQKGDRVSRGQSIAKVRTGDPGFVHFEVRKGYDSVDPMPYLD